MSQFPNQPGGAPMPPANQEGQGLAIAALICAFLIPLVGLILAIVAKSKGNSSGLVTAALIISIAMMVFGIIFGIACAGLILYEISYW